jgi:ubiquinone/menaquinone biosynthesis C-methylase UbiE
MSTLRDSWSDFSEEIAAKYLNGYGAPSQASKALLADILMADTENRKLRLIELGCGNGQMAEYFQVRGLAFRYLGIDFSDPLLAAGAKRFFGNDDISFLNDDVQQLSRVEGAFDYAIYSHVIEMLPSPEAALTAAKRVSRKIIIRFFEPPEFDATTVELLNLDVGAQDDKMRPYLRWKMGRDYYRLILARLDAKLVDVYRTQDKDQIHVIHFD